MKVKTVFPWPKLGKNDNSNPYMESTVLLYSLIRVYTCIRPLYSVLCEHLLYMSIEAEMISVVQWSVCIAQPQQKPVPRLIS